MSKNLVLLKLKAEKYTTATCTLNRVDAFPLQVTPSCTAPHTASLTFIPFCSSHIFYLQEVSYWPYHLGFFSYQLSTSVSIINFSYIFHLSFSLHCCCPSLKHKPFPGSYPSHSLITACSMINLHHSFLNLLTRPQILPSALRCHDFS